MLPNLETTPAVSEEEILAKAEAFARLIQSSPEYQTYIDVQEAMERDSEAQRAIASFQKYQQQIRMVQVHRGIMEEELQELGRLHRVCAETPAIRGMLQAQWEMIKLFHDLSTIISDTIGLDYEAACAPAGGCCG